MQFDLPSPAPRLLATLNRLFNAYCRLTRPGHPWRDFMAADTSRDAQVAAVERGIFAASA